MEQPPQDTDNPDPAGELTRAADQASAGGRVVVIAEADDGSAAQLIDLIPDGLGPVGRVVCTPTGKARMGGVAEDLGLDELESGVIVLEDAQWADPTSLGRLQRLVREGEGGLLAILAHRPVSGVDGWWIGRLAESARRHATVTTLALEGSGTEQVPPDFDPQGLDLVIASRLVPGAVSVPLAARLLDTTEPEVMGLAAGLVAEGWLGETRGGYLASPQGARLEAGEARVGYVAGRLAGVVEEMGQDPSLVGGLHLAAGRPDQAFPALAEAALAAQRRQAAGEAFHLAEQALEASEEAGVGDEELLGRLHLICGQFLRSAGRSDWAAQHLEKAASRLGGEARVDALGFAAAVADDLQHPQEAERVLAVAEWEASRLDEPAKLGSLLTLRARALSRIGFAEEADAALGKGLVILEQSASPVQRFYATINQAWIHFDRGEVAKAELEFTRLRDEARSLEGEASVADKEAWRARALFATGRPSDALEAIAVAQELAARQDVEAPLFLAELALVEGGLALGRYEQALAAADRVLDLVERQLPAWENMARAHRATALLRLGRIDEAGEEIAAALALTPPGADGWRYRIRCRALQMEIATAAGERWPAQEAEDLADHMLQSRLYGWAAELLCAIAERSKRKEAAREAMALAVQVGNPMLGARAAHAGSLWRDPAAAPVIRSMRLVQAQVPSDWEEEWRALPWVAAALEAPEPEADEGLEAATAALEQALQRAGLAGADVILSPAQRRSRGLVQRPRTIRPLTAVAAALAVVVLAGGTAFAVAELTREDPIVAAPPTVAPTTTLPPEIWETLIDAPGGVTFTGTVEHRGGPGRSGWVDANGPRRVTGYYWSVPTAGPIDTAPVALGQWVLVGSTEGTFYGIHQTAGRVDWSLPPEGRISASPALGRPDVTEGTAEWMVVVVTDDGVVRARQATSGRGGWTTPPLGARIRSSPVVVNASVLVATNDGIIYSLSLGSGATEWRHPAGGEGIGTVSADLAYEDGILYVGTEEGELHLIRVDSELPEELCVFSAQAGIVVNPLIVDDRVYVPTLGHQIWTLPAGSCTGPAADRQLIYLTEDPVEVAPAIVGDFMYLPDGERRFLYKMNLIDGRVDGEDWPANKVHAESRISAPPVVAGDTVYFGTEDGTVYAVDATDGEELWTWPTGGHMRGSPAVVDGAVFIVTGDGMVYAVGDGVGD